MIKSIFQYDLILNDPFFLKIWFIMSNVRLHLGMLNRQMAAARNQIIFLFRGIKSFKSSIKFVLPLDLLLR